ncbi:hypothetical protein [Streptomyces olivochromogenes]|uniref:hypothetical protein n=1 Tax=Streptomyces olivochromogenes TaxID=1963 RepID=UPI000748CA80|nr:hypothetical protein AQJ27_01840 [Streptomyces olivochromogenes]
MELPDRAAAIVHAFDCGLVVPGQGPRRQAVASGIAVRQRTGPAPGPWLRVSVLGPLRAWLAGQPVDVGPVRQRAVPAALAGCDRTQVLSGQNAIMAITSVLSGGSCPQRNDRQALSWRIFNGAGKVCAVQRTN